MGRTVVVNLKTGANPGVDLELGDTLIVAAPPRVADFSLVTGDERILVPSSSTGVSRTFKGGDLGGAAIHATWTDAVSEDASLYVSVNPRLGMTAGAKLASAAATAAIVGAGAFVGSRIAKKHRVRGAVLGGVTTIVAVPALFFAWLFSPLSGFEG